MNSTFFNEFLMISNSTTVVILGIFLLLLLSIYLMQKKGISFAKLVMLSTVLGAVLGFVVQFIADFPKNPMDVVYIKESTKWFSLVGGGFIELIRMLVVPVVFISIIKVILHMDKSSNLKKLISSTSFVFLVMVAIAALVGLLLGNFFHLGHGMSAIGDETSKMREVKPIVDTFKALIPSNPVSAMANTNVIGVVVFAVIMGSIARIIQTTKTHSLEIFTKLFDELHVIISWCADFIISLMPYGVLALLATTLAQKGFAAIWDMGLFIILIYVGVVVMLFVQSVLLSLFGVNPLKYFVKAKAPLILAFTSRSSMGVLPLTIQTLTKKLGVNSATASSVASFGTTAGMQGCAGIFPALCIVYIANISGIEMDLTMYIMSVVVIAIGSIGIAGVPGTSTMAASVSVSGTGLGSYFASLSPILAIDPIIDMGRTMLNVSGSMTNAIVVDKMMKTFNQEAFNDLDNK